MKFETLKDAQYALEDYKIKLKVTKRDIIDAEQQIAGFKRDRKEIFHPSRFVLIDSTRVSEMAAEQNVIIRKDNWGNKIEKWAKFWSLWEQISEDDVRIMMWQGPSRTDTQPYPEAVKARFVGYKVLYKPKGAGEPTTIDNYDEELDKFQKHIFSDIVIDRSFKDPAMKPRMQMMSRVKKSNESYWANRRKKSDESYEAGRPERDAEMLIAGRPCAGCGSAVNALNLGDVNQDGVFCADCWGSNLIEKEVENAKG